MLSFEQTNEKGFGLQTWDVAGNEANFFVRDITNGSRLPFRIRPGAPTSSLDIAANGDVGIGTVSPGGPLEISRPGVASVLFTTTAVNPDVTWSAGTLANGSAFAIGIGAGAPGLQLAGSGDLALRGSLGEAATAAAVTGAQAVDSAAILAKLAALSLNSWSFAATPGTRHLGPLAGDFATAFGLGSAAAIAPGDVAGVSLAAAQGLIAQNTALAARLQGAEAASAKANAANAKLGKRVGKLAKQMKKVRKALRQLGQ